jgi:alkylation response protein AidB-like acyl-CoA dehydrogenase
MRVCGGAAFRKEVGVERYFRDARAAGVISDSDNHGKASQASLRRKVSIPR